METCFRTCQRMAVDDVGWTRAIHVMNDVAIATAAWLSDVLGWSREQRQSSLKLPTVGNWRSIWT